MSEPLAAGSNISHYRIVSKIGAGGMGEVYLAEDTKLDRKVAIKFLNEEFSTDATKLNRFIQEAKAASALNHPNILTVYEIGEAEGANYIVTELIEGKTLREQLAQKESLQLSAILKIGIQAAEALSAAHQAGIIHRDIKPENIMIRKDGYAKVLDFGLAKLTEEKQSDEISLEEATKAFVKTNPGMVMGTVSYMSPEQARGKATDSRTDIWSLGAVLYEMLAGKVPFTGETVNHTIVSILEKEPLHLENVPGELQRIVRKSLTKDVDMRYQSARDLLIDLKNLRRDLDIQGELERSIIPNRAATTEVTNENETQVYAAGSVAATRSGRAAATHSVATSSSSLEYAVTQAKSHKLVTALVGIVLLGIVTTIAYFAFVSKGNSQQINSIAVLPFENRSGNPDSEYLSDGLAESLIYRLSQLPNLKVSPRSSVFRYKGKEIDAEKVGAELGVDAVMSGRIVQRGDSLTISVDLVDVKNKKSLWGEQYERKMSDLLTTQREIATAISEKLQLKLSRDEAKGVNKRYTDNNEAYQAYLKGRFYWNKRDGENIRKAIEQFKLAANKDPNYALAYVGLADCYAVATEYIGTPTSENLPQAKAYAKRALEIDDSLAEAHASLGLISDESWNWADAEPEFKKAIELNPNYPTTHHWYSLYLRYHGRPEEALVEIKRAYELDPLSIIISANLVETYLTLGDLNSAFAQAKKLIELDPNNWGPHYRLALVYLKQGNNPDALTEFQKAVDLSKRSSFTLSYYGYGLGVSGKRQEAVAIIKELEERYAKQQAGGRDLAYVYAGLSDKDQAFAWLEKDFQARSSALTELKSDFATESLRSDPRHKDLLRRMGLPQ
jgi:serine/threonine protein kinase/Tfp pilus assembly protein PilF